MRWFWSCALTTRPDDQPRRDLATLEASVRAGAYAMLEIATEVVEHLEDAGDAVAAGGGGRARCGCASAVNPVCQWM